MNDNIRRDDVNKGNDYGDSHNNEGSDSDDSEYLIDKNNIVEDIDVDMSEFYLNIDKDAEWVGGSNESVVEENSEEPAIEVLDNETLLSKDEELSNQRNKSARWWCSTFDE